MQLSTRTTSYRRHAPPGTTLTRHLTLIVRAVVYCMRSNIPSVVRADILKSYP